MDIKIGDESGCLEIIGDCIEVENDLQETINQWAAEEWCQFDEWYSYEEVEFKEQYNLSKLESKIYDDRGSMPKSFVAKYRKKCDDHEMLWNMKNDERFLWHESKPNTRYLAVKGCRDKKLYKVKCNLCNRVFFMDSGSFQCVRWYSCVGAKCLASTVNEKEIDYSKSLYNWNIGENELEEMNNQLAKVEELSTSLTYYSAGTLGNTLKIAYISDIHLHHHLKCYNNDAKKMVRDIGRKLYQSKRAANIIIFNGDISSGPDLVIMFFNQFIREYDYEKFQVFKKKLNQLKEKKEKNIDIVSKYAKCKDNIDKYIEKRKDELKAVFDFTIFEKYKEKYHSNSRHETAYEYFRKTKSFKKCEVSEHTEVQIQDIVRLLDIQMGYVNKIGYFENAKREEQYEIEIFETRYSKFVEELLLTDYIHMDLEDISEDIYVILGNHEYIGFPDVQTSVSFYKEVLLKLGIKVLHNEYNETSKYLLYGGTGFAKYDKVWNADKVVCCTGFTREDEIAETTSFENGYIEALRYAKRNGLCFLCASHYPISECLGSFDKEAIYFTGHNHRNEYVKIQDKVLYADNQVGYYNNNVVPLSA